MVFDFYNFVSFFYIPEKYYFSKNKSIFTKFVMDNSLMCFYNNKKISIYRGKLGV